MAKVDVQLTALHQRRGAGVAVFPMYRRSRSGILREDFRVPNDLAVLGTQTERALREFISLQDHRSCQKEPAFDERRGGPALAGDLLFPGDVFGFAPLDGQVLLRGDAVAQWTAKLGPIGG